MGRRKRDKIDSCHLTKTNYCTGSKGSLSVKEQLSLKHVYERQIFRRKIQVKTQTRKVKSDRFPEKFLNFYCTDFHLTKCEYVTNDIRRTVNQLLSFCSTNICRVIRTWKVHASLNDIKTLSLGRHWSDCKYN